MIAHLRNVRGDWVSSRILAEHYLLPMTLRGSVILDARQILLQRRNAVLVQSYWQRRDQ